MKLNALSGAAIAAAAATLIASGTLHTPEAKAANSSVKCFGLNSCKGHGSCKSLGNGCKGQNACKGQGFKMMSKQACKAKGGSTTRG